MGRLEHPLLSASTLRKWGAATRQAFLKRLERAVQEGETLEGRNVGVGPGKQVGRGGLYSFQPQMFLFKPRFAHIHVNCCPNALSRSGYWQAGGPTCFQFHSFKPTGVYFQAPRWFVQNHACISISTSTVFVQIPFVYINFNLNCLFF